MHAIRLAALLCVIFRSPSIKYGNYSTQEIIIKKHTCVFKIIMHMYVHDTYLTQCCMQALCIYRKGKRLAYIN